MIKISSIIVCIVEVCVAMYGKRARCCRKVKPIRKHIGEKCPDPVEEIHLVGHAVEPSVSLLFSPSGEFCHL
jgi:hypothetical protein